MTPYEGCKVTGPYPRIDGRSHVIIYFPDGSKHTVSYPRYLLAIKFGRYLTDEEEAHHKDLDCTNDNIDNLEIKDKLLHSYLHNPEKETEIWTCAFCGTKFEANSKKINNRNTNIKRGKSKTGPFCSKRCNGKVNN